MTTSAITQPAKLTLRHYGASRFRREKFRSILDAGYLNKPIGGFWGSPIHSNWSWAHWCKDNSFGKLTEWFDIDFEGNLLTIDSLADLEKLPHTGCVFKFEPLVERGVDAIHLTEKGQYETHLSMPKNLYGWDCESVVVFNVDCLREIVR